LVSHSGAGGAGWRWVAQTLKTGSPNTDKVVLHVCPRVTLPVWCIYLETHEVL
jgi:hypothetical protein